MTNPMQPYTIPQMTPQINTQIGFNYNINMFVNPYYNPTAYGGINPWMNYYHMHHMNPLTTGYQNQHI